MLRQLDMVTLIHAIQQQIEANTGLPCYDNVEPGTASPFYYIQISGMRPANSKTAFRDIFTVLIHVIAEPGGSMVNLSNHVQKLQEALTVDITLDPPFQSVSQLAKGITTIQTDETGEKHAVLTYEFTIIYGYKCKVLGG